MGFHRHPQPDALDRAAIVRLALDEVAFELRAADPFLVDHDCLNPAGHTFIASCGDIVCCHCTKVICQ